jgi:excisionase family DNA binding protein
MNKKLVDKEKAAEVLGISVRTLQRHMSARRIGFVMRPGRTGDEAMFDRDELARFKQAKKSAVKVIVPSVMPSDSPLSSAVRPDDKGGQQDESMMLASRAVDLREATGMVIQELFSRLEERAANLAKKKPTAMLSEKLMLSMREAAVLSGLSEDKLREAVEEGKLTRFKGIGRGAGKLRREDLEKYIKSL